MEFPSDFVNKIICGDCLEVMKKMPDECLDLVVTSPPYNLAIRKTFGNTQIILNYNLQVMISIMTICKKKNM